VRPPILLLLVLTLVLPSVAHAASDQLVFRFDPRVAPRYRATVTRVATAALTHATAVAGPLQRPVVVSVLRYRGSFIQETGMPWAVGCAGAESVTIPISEYLFTTSVTSSDPGPVQEAPLATVLRHEFTHCSVLQRFPRAPAWLNEGLAQMADGTCVDDAVTTAYRKLDTCDAGRPALVMAQASFGSYEVTPAPAYQVALSLVRHLVDLHGRDAPQRLLAALADGSDQDEALRAVTGQDQREFLRRWRLWLYDWVLRKKRTGAPASPQE